MSGFGTGTRWGGGTATTQRSFAPLADPPKDTVSRLSWITNPSDGNTHWLACSSWDGTVRIWEFSNLTDPDFSKVKSSGKVIIPNDGDPVLRVTFSDEGRLYYATASGKLKVHKTATTSTAAAPSGFGASRPASTLTSSTGGRTTFGTGSSYGFGGGMGDIDNIHRILAILLGDRYVADERKIPVMITGLRWVRDVGCDGASCGLFITFTHHSQDSCVMSLPLDDKDKLFQLQDKTFPIRCSVGLQSKYGIGSGLKFVDLDLFPDSQTLFAATNLGVLALDIAKFRVGSQMSMTAPEFSAKDTKLSGQISALAALPDGYVAGSTHGQIEICRGGNLYYLPEFVIPSNRAAPAMAYTVNCVAGGPGGALIGAGGTDGRVVIYREDGLKSVLAGSNSPVTAIAFAPDGCPYIAVATGYDWSKGAEEMNRGPDRHRPVVTVRPIPADKDFR